MGLLACVFVVGMMVDRSVLPPGFALRVSKGPNVDSYSECAPTLTGNPLCVKAMGQCRQRLQFQT